MINTKKQAFYTVFIVIGAALLLYDLAFESDEVYLKVAGLVILMFGLYSSTRQWANDNDKSKNENDELENTTTKKDEDVEDEKQK
ncbi:hypothetical protein [Psychroflexus planctonicus]|uniref:Uncharacterized protein n=1 Tax=Psychroflexus planctonicus TaxID=1526575 RepID=A0ABQ1SG07_9FLAO|nr:hypothetical protein [Psychroflexus planctonicus]GGE31858.1 hypothetical protein GCM10010832_10230 [Psychroflexus planctonicus]